MSLLLLLLVLAQTPSPSASPSVPGTWGTVVVTPPEGQGAPELAWVGEAVADTLPRALAALGVPVVDRADRLRAQEALEIPAVALTRASSIRIAEAMGASRLVVGSYRMDGPSLLLSLRMLDLERGSLSAPLVAAGPPENLSELTYGVAWDIALTSPTPPVGTREEFLARRQPIPFEAFKAYAQGLSAPDQATRIKQIKRALGLVPAYDEARVALGRLQLQARDYAAARDTLSGVAPSSPHSRPARFLEGVALLELGRYREAASVYARLEEDDPTPAVLNNRAIALMRGESAEAKPSQLLRRGVALDPTTADLSFNLGWALLSEGEPEAAAFWLRGVLQQNPRDVHGRIVLSWALRMAGKVAEAEEEWKAVSALSSTHETLTAPNLKRRFERILNTERPLVLDREEGSDPEIAARLMRRAEKLSEAGDLEGAIRELTRAAYLDPHSARIHLLLGRSYRARGDKESAMSELRMSLWCREDLAVRAELATVLSEVGRMEEARAEAEKVLEKDPSNEAARRIKEGPN